MPESLRRLLRAVLGSEPTTAATSPRQHSHLSQEVWTRLGRTSRDYEAI